MRLPRSRLAIRRIMALIAIIAGFLALSRYPFALGLVLAVGGISLFVALSFRWKRYDPVAWLVIAYPALPLATLYVHWYFATLKVVPRGSQLFEGLIGLSEVGVFLCLFAYVACVSLVAGGRKARHNPSAKRAAWKVVVLMPISWAALGAFFLWDPLGMLGYFFR